MKPINFDLCEDIGRITRLDVFWPLLDQDVLRSFYEDQIDDTLWPIMGLDILRLGS